MGQTGEMRDALLDRPFVLGPLNIGHQLRMPAPGRRVLAELQHDVFRAIGSHIFAFARIGSRRMSRDEVQDLEPILDIAQPLLEAAAFRLLGGHSKSSLLSSVSGWPMRHYSILETRAEFGHNKRHG